MQKLPLKSMIVLALTLFALPTFATNIQNINITPSGNYLEFSWDPIDNSEIDQETNYALQWSQFTSDIRLDKQYSSLLSLSKNTYRMRGDRIFEKNVDYYSRVYTYYRENRQTHLLKGSKILKFKWLLNGNIETSLSDANDPSVVDSSGGTTTAAQSFGNTSAIPYDISAQISWSRVTEAFDEYVLVLSSNSDLSDPISEFKVTDSYHKALITGLETGKKYYIAGYLERNGRKFGKGETINFTTLAKFDSVKQARYQKYILDKKKYGKLLSTGATTSSESSYEETIITETSSDATIKNRISELKSLIAKYQAELNKLQGTNSTTTTTSSGSSLSSRLRNWRSRR